MNLLAETKDVSIQESAEQIVIAPFSSTHLNQIESDRIRSLLLRTSAKQQLYHLVLGKIQKNDQRKLNALILNISKQDENYSIDIRISSIKSNKIVKRVKSLNFPENQLFLNVEKALYAIYNLEYTPELKDKINKQKKKSKTPSKKLKNPTKKEVTDLNKKKNLDFKERIKAFKKDIKKQFVEKSKEVNEEKKKKAIESAAAEMKKKEEELQKSNNPDIETESKLLATGFSWNSGYSAQNFTSHDLVGSGSDVEIFTDFQYLFVGGELKLIFVPMDEISSRIIFHYFFPLSSDDRVELRPYFDLSIYGTYEFRPFYSILSLGVESDTLMFGSLPEFGAGVELFEYNVQSLVFEYNFEIYNYGLIYRIYNNIGISSQNEFGVFEEATFAKNFYGIYMKNITQNDQITFSFESAKLNTTREFENEVVYSRISATYSASF